MLPEHQARLRELPKIDELLRRDDLRALAAPRWAVVEAIRREVDERRQAILAGAGGSVEITAAQVEGRVAELLRPSLRRVINATGVVLHTNLGRAPLAAAAAARVAELAVGYSNLEYDVGERGRGSRHAHLAELLRQLTGAEDAVVVNNNAGAVMLALAALAAGRAVVVSRGELIEIGGSFRIPDVMRLSGARLCEVGTTNKTHRRDYEAAIGAETALLLKVHRSNFALVGFTAEVELPELVELGRSAGVAVMIDLGSGALLAAEELAALGLPPEPSVAQVMASGVDLCTFSGDKLLGGPQAGVIAGRRQAIQSVRAHPLMRALRPDKMTLAALEATLALYRDGRALAEVPALAMLAAGADTLRGRAEELARRIGAAPAWLEAAVVAVESAVGGGALPTAKLASFALALSAREPGPDRAPADLERRLRAAPLPVVGRIAEDRLLLDVRTVRDDELDAVAAAVRAL